NAGVQRVGQREIDDARLAAEIDGRLCATVGQFLQAAATTAGKHVCHGITCQGLVSLLHSVPPSYACSSSSMIVASGGNVMVAAIVPPASTACTRPPLPLPLPQ